MSTSDDQSKAALIAAQEKIVALETYIQKQDKEYQAIQASNRGLRETIKKLQEKLEVTESLNASFETTVQELKRELAEGQQEKKGLEQELAKERQEKQEMDAAFQKTIQDLQAVREAKAVLLQTVLQLKEKVPPNRFVQDGENTPPLNVEDVIGTMRVVVCKQPTDDSGASSANDDAQKELDEKSYGPPNAWVEKAWTLLNDLENREKGSFGSAMQILDAYMRHIPSTHPMLSKIQQRRSECV